MDFGVCGGPGTNPQDTELAATALYWDPSLGKGAVSVVSAITLVVAIGTAPELSSALGVLGAYMCFSAYVNATKFVNPQNFCSLNALAGLSVNGECVNQMFKGPSEACFSLPAGEPFSAGGVLMHRNGPSCPVTRSSG